MFPHFCQRVIRRESKTDSFSKGPTLVCRIDVEGEINVQVGKFLENIKRAGRNRRAGGKFSRKSIIVQGGNFLENQ